MRSGLAIGQQHHECLTLATSILLLKGPAASRRTCWSTSRPESPTGSTSRPFMICVARWPGDVPTTCAHCSSPAWSEPAPKSIRHKHKGHKGSVPGFEFLPYCTNLPVLGLTDLPSILGDISLMAMAAADIFRQPSIRRCRTCMDIPD